MMTNKSWHGFLFLLSIVFCLVAQTGPVYAKNRSTAARTIRDLNMEIADANGRQDLPGALQAADKAVHVAKKEFGGKSQEAGDAMNNLANLYLFADRAAEAEQLLKQVVLISLKKKDKKGTEMADLYVNLGIAYAAQKKYSDALKILNNALVIRREKLGPDNIATKKVEEMMDDFSKLAYPNAERI
ncbi:MAG: tetratricopeptide repeat protein [Candidatus Omnitrophota bacterium]